MCGIAGWRLTERPASAFVLSLMQAMESRGHQSFGLFDGETKHITRAVGAITNVLSWHGMEMKEGFFHTRHATQGKIVAENSHPFEIGDLIGAHNGIIYNHRELNAEYKRNCKVDSEHIFHQIVDGLPTDKLEGYAAIEYFQNGEYFLASSNNSDLHVAQLANGIVWASTEESIKTACFQSGYEIKHFFQIDDGETYRAEIDGLYRVDIPFNLKESFVKIDWRSFKDEKFSKANYEDYKQNWDTAFSTDTMRENSADDMPEDSEPGEPVLRSIGPDICDWCGEYKECLTLSDSTLACYACADEMADEMGEIETEFNTLADTPIMGDE